MNSVGLFLACLIAGAFGNPSRIGPQTVPSHHVGGISKKFTSDAPAKLPNAMNRTMILSFETDDITFSLDLELNTKLYTKFTKVYAKDENGNTYLRPRRYRSYTGTGTITENNNIHGEEADCSVTFYKDSRFHAVCVTEDDVYSVDLSELSKHYNGPIRGSDSGEGLLLTRKSEVIDEPYGTKDNKNSGNKKKEERGNLFTQKMRQFHKNLGKNSAELMGSRRSLLDQSNLIKFDSCFTGQTDYVHQLNIGIITDTAYNAVFSYDNDNIESSIEAIFNDATGSNMVYYYQLNVYLAIGEVYIGATYSGYSYDPANYASGYTINSRLDEMTNWRKEYLSKNSNDQHGLWHLLTNHHPPAGTVGLAYVGVICSTNYGTGVSNYISYSPGTWPTFAHEVGHNFGGDHAFDEGQGSTGGIMDYGDGKYNGAYQFHPVYTQSDICDEIESSKQSSPRWSLMDLDNCWHEYDGSSTGGVVTPSPTASSDGSTPSPTSPTAQPTDKPTGAPTEDSNTYVWYWTSSWKGYGDCQCVNGEAIKYKIYGCWTVTTSGSTSQYYSTDTSNCDASTEPTTDSESCSDELTCGSTDNTDDSGDDSGGSTDDSGSTTDSVTNAVFRDSNGRVYVIEGDYYNRYSSYFYGWSNNSPDSGYPQRVSTGLGINSFSGSEITAIAYASDSEIYVFNNFQYTKIDLDSGEYSGYPKTFTDDYKVASSIVSCGEITAATMNSGYFFLFCGNNYGYADDYYTISSYGTWGSNNVVGVYAIGSSIYAFYEGSNIFRRRRMINNDHGLRVGELGNINDILSNGGAFVAMKHNINQQYHDNLRRRRRLADDDTSDDSEAECYDSNCISCSGTNSQICYECTDEYVLYGSVKCLANTTLLYLDFDIYSSLTVDHFFTENSHDELLSDYKYSFDGVTGENSTAMIFDGSTKLDLQPLDYADTNEYVNSFKITYRFKPYSIDYDKLISIDNDNVEIILSVNNDKRSNDTADYIALFKVGNNTYESTIGYGLTVGDWNTVEMQYSEDIFTIYINGETIEQAYSNTEWADVNVELKFSEWYIGNDDGTGIDGEMDQVSFKVIETDYYIDESDLSTSIIYRTVESDKYKTYLWVAICAIIVAVILCVGFVVMTGLYCKAKRKQPDSTADGTYFRMG